MKKLIVNKIEGYNYFFSDMNKEYKINIEFYNTNYIPQVGDYLYITDKILNSINNQMISCGPIDSEYGKMIEHIDDELFVFIHENKKIYLKRYYG